MTSVVTLTFVVWSTFCHLLTGSAITSQSCPAFCSSLANVDFPTAVDVQKTHLHYQLDFKLSLHVRTGLLGSIYATLDNHDFIIFSNFNTLA